MSAPGQLTYDPLTVFVEVFSDPQFAADVAFAFDCREVNVLAGLLEAHGQPAAAARWLAHHLDDCDDPSRHLH